MQITSDQIVDFIANHSKELAGMAKDAGHEALAYILDMAEAEARNLSVETKRKKAA